VTCSAAPVFSCLFHVRLLFESMVEARK
jgi:hypothetical protein